MNESRTTTMIRGLNAAGMPELRKISDETAFLPLMIANMVLTELEQHFDSGCQDRDEIGYLLEVRLDYLYTNNYLFRKNLNKSNGRDTLYALTRHWIMGILEGQFNGKQIPREFGYGHPIFR